MGKGKIVIMTTQECFNYCLKQLAKCDRKIAFLTGMTMTCAVVCGYLIGEVHEHKKRVNALEKKFRDLEQSEE